MKNVPSNLPTAALDELFRPASLRAFDEGHRLLFEVPAFEDAAGTLHCEFSASLAAVEGVTSIELIDSAGLICSATPVAAMRRIIEQ